jgi:hypothetical protein
MKNLFDYVQPIGIYTSRQWQFIATVEQLNLTSKMFFDGHSKPKAYI